MPQEDTLRGHDDPFLSPNNKPRCVVRSQRFFQCDNFQNTKSHHYIIQRNSICTRKVSVYRVLEKPVYFGFCQCLPKNQTDYKNNLKILEHPETHTAKYKEPFGQV